MAFVRRVGDAGLSKARPRIEPLREAGPFVEGVEGIDDIAIEADEIAYPLGERHLADFGEDPVAAACTPALQPGFPIAIGRTSCRGEVCPYVENTLVAVS